MNILDNPYIIMRLCLFSHIKIDFPLISPTFGKSHWPKKKKTRESIDDLQSRQSSQSVPS